MMNASNCECGDRKSMDSIETTFNCNGLMLLEGFTLNAHTKHYISLKQNLFEKIQNTHTHKNEMIQFDRQLTHFYGK